MSWGTKIAMLYSGFVIMIITLVTLTFYNKSELVAEDYYQRETLFQQQLNAELAAKALGENIQLNKGDYAISLQFPRAVQGQVISGTVHFYAAAQAAADRSFPLEQVTGNTWTIERNKLGKANYEVRVSWKAGGKDYYQAMPLNLQ